MKKLIIIIVFLNPLFCLAGDWDMVATITLIQNHKKHYKVLSRISYTDFSVKSAQEKLKTEAEKLKTVEQELFNRLKSVRAALQNAQQILYAKNIVLDIAKYQKQMLGEAQDNPELLLVAIQTETLMIKRSRKMIKEVIASVLATDFNLADNNERAKLIKFIIYELRTIRGIAYSITRQIRSAKRGGLIKALSKQSFDFEDDRKKIADKIREEYQLFKTK